MQEELWPRLDNFAQALLTGSYVEVLPVSQPSALGMISGGEGSGTLQTTGLSLCC